MPDRVQCLPVFAVRTGGVPVGVLEKLRSKRLIEKRQEISRAWNRLERAANHVIDMLYDAIGTESDSKKRVKILELRRQLLDRAKIYKFTTERIGNLLSLECQKEVHALIEIAMQHRELLHEYEELYAGEMHRIRLDFKKAITNANYLHGVLFASHSLYSNTDKYLKSDNNTDLQRADRLVESHIAQAIACYYERLKFDSKFTLRIPLRNKDVSFDEATSMVETELENVSGGAFSELAFSTAVNEARFRLLQPYDSVTGLARQLNLNNFH